MSSNGKPTSNVMRKSCQFCRSRKIRCSGERICNACRVRSIDCIYGLEGNRGRPRADKNKTEIRKGTPSRSRSNRLVRNGIPESVGSADFQATQDSLLGHELEAVFRLAFLGISSPGSPSSNPSATGTTGTHSSYHDPVESSALLAHLSTNSSFFDSNLSNASSPSNATAPTRTTISYEDLFTNISYGLVELLSNLFGSLGCRAPQQSIASYVANNLNVDSTSTMFDLTPSPEPLPRSDFGEEHYVKQMIELWFMHHPLSLMVSKTLVLHRLRNGTIDQALLAVILADANYGLGGQKVETAQRLFSTATEILKNQHRSACSLATIQAMILLGWHKTCYDSARRGYIYMSSARRFIVDIQRRTIQNPPSMTDCINGIPVAKVEAELIQRIFSFSSGLELWTCIQLDVPLCNKIPRDVPFGFPPLDASQSFVFRLDQESGNVASLRRQERLLRQFWPLCHISSTLIRVYEYYTKSTEGISTWTPDEKYTGPLTLIRLRRLLRSRDANFDTCHSIRETLLKIVSTLENDHSLHICQHATIGAYRVILLHLLFPSAEAENVFASITEMTVQVALREILQFRDFLTQVDTLPPAELEVIDSSRRCTNEIFLMGIDACGKALERLVDAGTYGSPQVQESIGMCRGDFFELTCSLHKISKHPKIQILVGADESKRRLKSVKQKLEGRPGQVQAQQNPSGWPGVPAIADGAWMHNAAYLRMPTGLDSQMPAGDFVGQEALQMHPNLNWGMSQMDGYGHTAFEPTTGA